MAIACFISRANWEQYSMIKIDLSMCWIAIKQNLMESTGSFFS